jgi:hypothetical protein
LFVLTSTNGGVFESSTTSSFPFAAAHTFLSRFAVITSRISISRCMTSKFVCPSTNFRLDRPP